ncbi:MAG TPA: O-methyltransferase [Capillimicrobium sp.]|nr:O-methyltransferase [Capillimicrobium sp.]
MSDLDDYAAARTTPPEPELDALYADTVGRLGHEPMLTGPVAGRLLETLVFLARPRLVLEVGTFSGYSALSMARALPPDGRIVTLEIDPERAAFARERFAASPYAGRIEVVVGPALDGIAAIDAPIDVAFVDADKESYADYYEAIVPKLAPHGLLIADNTLRGGRVLDPDDERGREMDRFNRHVQDDPRTVNVLLTVRDGITLVRRR